MRFSKTLIGVLCLCPLLQFAQEISKKPGYAYRLVQDSTGKQSPRGIIIDSKNVRTAVIPASTANPGLMNRYIVRLAGTPILKAGGTMSRTAQAVEGQHQQFESDFAALDRRTNSAGRTASHIHLHFKKVFNGVAITASPELVQAIRKFSYVSDVIEDKLAKATDFSTNQIINADKVWTQFSTTGAGIRIGIIDTGIDYNHEALGGGFGPGFKVAGGYDFVNEDNDPMDDFGHGTHVAGIASANGATLKGVAPGATLIAYKVLNESGSGFYSWIIAGIERSVDPDQNPATDDKLDVVNMSLGGSPTRDDPMMEAVENAVRAGVVYCVAAGNSGSGVMTIMSPGTSEHAITVGATDNNDQVAWFSSRGPSSSGMQMKPDVTAPGVDVNSSFMGGGYTTLSGTSMATPHVTGAVALIKSLHPNWSPDMIKGVLMQTASPINGSVWDRGMGRIDVLKALKADFVLAPGSLSMGAVDHSVSQWSKTYPVEITNLSNQTQTISLQTTGDLNQPAVTTSISQSTVILIAGQTISISATIDIQTAALPLIPYPNFYLGNIVASSPSQSASLPVTFVNSNMLNLHFENPLPDFVIVANKQYFNFVTPAAQDVQLLVPDGVYEIAGNYYNRWIMKEGVTPSSQVLTFDKANSKNRIIFKPVDENGNAINPFLRGLTYLERRDVFYTLYPGSVDTLYFDDVSDNYEVSYEITDFASAEMDKYYNTVIAVSGGIQTSMTVSNDPNGYLPVNYSFPRQPGSSYGFWGVESAGSRFSYFDVMMMDTVILDKDFRCFFQEKDRKSPFLKSLFRFTPQNHATDKAWETAGMNVYGHDSISFDVPRFMREIDHIQGIKPFQYAFGKSLLHWNSDIYLADSALIVDGINYTGYFIRSLGEKERGRVKFELLSNHSVIDRDSVANLFFWEWTPKSFTLPEPGKYTLRASYMDYEFRGIKGKAVAEVEFNNTLADKNPPVIMGLAVHAGGQPTDSFDAGNPAKLLISISDSGPQCILTPCENDESFSFKVNAWIREAADTAWNVMPLEVTGFHNREASLSFLKEGIYSIKLHATDPAGNSLQQTLDPAFLVGPNLSPPPPDKPALINPVAGATGVPTNPYFVWSKMYPAVSYTLQLSKGNNFAQPDQEVIVSVEDFQFSTFLDPSSDYFWRVRANYPLQRFSPWSDIGEFTTGLTPYGQVTLVSPQRGMVNTEWDLNFTWNRSQFASTYRIEVSPEEDFSSLFADVTVADTFVFIAKMLPARNYYWRVQGLGSISFAWSEASVFTTRVIQKPFLREPSNIANNQPLNEYFSWTDVGAESYTIQIYLDAELGQLYAERTSAQPWLLESHMQPLWYYYWRVRGNLGGTSSEWSDTFVFFTGGISQPNLYAPSDQATNQTRDVYFQWSDVMVDSYTLQISLDAAFNTILAERIPVQNSFTEPGLKPDTKYYWRVRGKSIWALSEWSEVFSFTTSEISIPILLSPFDQGTNQQLNLMFTWSASIVDSYTLQISKDSVFNAIYDERIVTQPSFIEFGLDPNAGYYWRVKANSGGASSAWSETFVFTTIEIPIPILLQPSNGATGQPWAVYLSWTDVSVDSYTLQISKDSGFNLISSEQTTVQTFVEASGLEPKADYFWRVRGKSGSSSSAWSDAFSFTTIAIPVPALLQPSNYATGQPRTLSFIWTYLAVDSYTVQISRDESFNTIDVQLAPVQPSVETTLDHDSEYFWRVRGNLNGSSSGWSVPFQFNTAITVTGLNSSPEEGNLSVFPNPSPGQVTVLYHKDPSYPSKLIVENVLGEMILTIGDDDLSGGAKSVSIDLQQKAAGQDDGIYFVIYSNGKNYSAKKVVIRR